MERIALPLAIPGANGAPLQVAASADVFVDLVEPEARGIHMSRLYLRLQDALAAEAITPAGLRRVLQDCIDSQGGLSRTEERRVGKEWGRTVRSRLSPYP